jgi:GNAT-family acetyltransferase (TIGR03103 family)
MDIWHEDAISTRSSWNPPEQLSAEIKHEVAVECGWGRLIFGQTFPDHRKLLSVLHEEAPGRRDICLYVREPHVLVSLAPHELFIDPSVTYRLWLNHYERREDTVHGIVVRPLREVSDADAINRLYAATGMVTTPTETVCENHESRTFSYLVAEDLESGQIVGTVTGVDHRRAFNDPEGGTSLWCLAVDPQTAHPGVGEALVRALAEHFQDDDAVYLDLSVIHDNVAAIALYEKLGFVRVPVFCVKRKNPINERLFAGPVNDFERLNPYARIIADEAVRRGIRVEVLDAEWGELRLSHGGREVVTRESLSELTTAVAMSRCDDKRVTRRLLQHAGLSVPRGRVASFDAADEVFLGEVSDVVVKPARGEQGRGITVGIRDRDTLERALELAQRHCPDVLIEERVDGEDLRVVVIDHEVVAAAVRRPAHVIGTGRHTIEELIRAQSRRRAAATGGESHIPLDSTTIDTVRQQGYEPTQVLAKGTTLSVRRTANLHTGGTIHDVTAALHPDLAKAAVAASEVLDIPVVGLDLMVPAVDRPEHVFIEANERPGLANHEPQPTAQRFVDLLFPATRPLPQGWDPGLTGKHRTHQV